MVSDKCNLAVAQEESHITLNGIDESPLIIDYSGDIELTGLVTLLAKRIDTGRSIELEIPEEDDEKLKLVIETISDIVEKFNESVQPVEEPVETLTRTDGVS